MKPSESDVTFAFVFICKPTLTVNVRHYDELFTVRKMRRLVDNNHLNGFYDMRI